MLLKISQAANHQSGSKVEKHYVLKLDTPLRLPLFRNTEYPGNHLALPAGLVSIGQFNFTIITAIN